jgi:DNA-directed RNA polymerase specialized sigma24 family protein
MGGHPDVEDVVQETMLLVVRDLPALRQPESVRAWALAIAMRRVGAHRERATATEARVAVVADVPGPVADFEELAIVRLRLTGERRQVAEASRWLDDEDRTVLALWWQEAAGELSRAEVAGALNTGTAYAAVRIQRMRGQLDRRRALVAALAGQPRCAELDGAIKGWDGRPVHCGANVSTGTSGTAGSAWARPAVRSRWNGCWPGARCYRFRPGCPSRSAPDRPVSVAVSMAVSVVASSAGCAGPDHRGRRDGRRRGGRRLLRVHLRS